MINCYTKYFYIISVISNVFHAEISASMQIYMKVFTHHDQNWQLVRGVSW